MSGVWGEDEEVEEREEEKVKRRKMEVEEPWLGLWLPLNYRVDMGSSLAYDNGIWYLHFVICVDSFHKNVLYNIFVIFY